LASGSAEAPISATRTAVGGIGGLIGIAGAFQAGFGRN
jgi:hypothetical protein